jgi:hypothetical protein
MLAELVAQRLLTHEIIENVALTDTFCPTDPNDTLTNLYELVGPTETKPLIVLLDEVDVLYDQIVNQTIGPHKELPILIRSKTDWNGFFDKFDRLRYPHVILLMTSNRSVREFDESMVRDGRICVKY